MPKAPVKIERRGRPATGITDAQKASVRIPTEMYEEIARLAQEETRTMNGEVVQLLKEALAARRNQP